MLGFKKKYPVERNAVKCKRHLRVTCHLWVHNLSKNTERWIGFYFCFEKCHFSSNRASLFIYTVHDSLRVLGRSPGVQVSLVPRSWHFFWGFVCPWMATEPTQSSIWNSINVFWQTCLLFHPWILSKVGTDAPSSGLDREHPLLWLQFDLRLCPLLLKSIPELGPTAPFYFCQFILERKIMCRRFLCKKKKNPLRRQSDFL